MNTQLFPVPFHQDTIVLVGQNDEPFVAMKPIVENMGLSWNSQHTKLTEKFASGIAIIGTTGGDGKQYEMVCLPLRKLPGWLYSISPNKVAPELRDKIIQYQEECDDALWRYWTQSSVETRPQAMPKIDIRLKKMLAVVKMIEAQNRTAVRANRQLLQSMITETATGLGLSYQPDMLDGAHA